MGCLNFSPKIATWLSSAILQSWILLLTSSLKVRKTLGFFYHFYFRDVWKLPFQNLWSWSWLSTKSLARLKQLLDMLLFFLLLSRTATSQSSCNSQYHHPLHNYQNCNSLIINIAEAKQFDWLLNKAKTTEIRDKKGWPQG